MCKKERGGEWEREKKKGRQAGRRQVRSLLPVCHIDVFMFSCIGLPIRLYLSHYI